MISRFLITTTAVTLVLSAAATADEAPGQASSERGQPPLSNPDYRGRLVGDANGKVLIRYSAGRVQMQFRNVDQVCEDGIRQSTYMAGPATVEDDGRFTDLVDLGPADSNNNLLVSLARGRLEKNRASGQIFFLGDVYDPPGDDGNYDECWSDGVVRWRAAAVSGGDGHFTPEPAPPATIRPGTYTGKTSNGAFSISIKRQAGGSKLRATFKSDLQLDCDGDDEPITKVRARFAAPTGRPLDYLRPEARAGQDRSVLWITARAHGDEKLRGGLGYFEDPWDPEGSVNEPECGTGAVESWTAKRSGP